VACRRLHSIADCTQANPAGKARVRDVLHCSLSQPHLCERPKRWPKKSSEQRRDQQHLLQASPDLLASLLPWAVHPTIPDKQFVECSEVNKRLFDARNIQATPRRISGSRVHAKRTVPSNGSSALLSAASFEWKSRMDAPKGLGLAFVARFGRWSSRRKRCAPRHRSAMARETPSAPTRTWVASSLTWSNEPAQEQKERYPCPDTL